MSIDRVRFVYLHVAIIWLRLTLRVPRPIRRNIKWPFKLTLWLMMAMIMLQGAP